MKPRLFISYSHQDKEFCQNFRKHLKPLELADEIEVWYDKELLPGDEITPEILNKLNESDIVVFLMSPDFFVSKFIQDIEVKKSLEKGKKAIPVVLKECLWKIGPLAKFLACPEDGKPVNKFPDQDTVWTEVVLGIRKTALSFSEREFQEAKGFVLNDEWKDKLNKSEVAFFHKNKDVLALDDIYVFPDLKKVKDESSEEYLEKTINSEKLLSSIGDENKVLIVGEEQSGKTSLCKMLFRIFFEKEYLPIYLNVSGLSSIEVDKQIEREVQKQYSNLSLSEFLTSPKKKVFIIDDFQNVRLNKKYQKVYLEELEKLQGIVLVIGDKILQFNEREYLVFSRYLQFELLSLGHRKRNELITKWFSVDQVETIDEVILENLVDKTEKNIDQIIRGNVVPPKPVYVLTIIQTLEVSKPGEYGLTSYGHCYQSLILHALNKMNINHQDFDTYFNYLRELAFSIYLNDSKALDENKRKEFETKYSSVYVVQSHDVVQKNLILANVLENQNGNLSFRYKYLYYFYVAKHIAEKAGDKLSKEILENLLINIHSEKNANILIFLIHHTKDQKIIEDILLHTMCVFDGVQEENLDIKSLEFMNGLFDSIPKLLLEQKSVEEERKKQLAAMDDYEAFSQKTKEEQEKEIEEENKQVNDMVKSARAVEIIGQILRNYHGSLEKNDLKSLSDQGINVGLRFLRFYLSILENSKDQILELLGDFLKKRKSGSETDAIKEAKRIYLTICYQMSFAVVWKISNSMGEERLIQIIKEISEERPNSPVVKLIEVLIKLEYSKEFPRKEISELAKMVSEDNPFVFRLLQHVTLQHLYLHSTNRKERQWISDTLKISISHQLLIEEKKERKL